MTSCSLVNRRRSSGWLTVWRSRLIRSDAVFDCCNVLSLLSGRALGPVIGYSACIFNNKVLRFFQSS